MISLQQKEREDIVQDLMRHVFMFENELNNLRIMGKRIQEVSKESILYFTDKELRRIFYVMHKEVTETYCEMQEQPDGSKKWEEAVCVYKAAVLDEAFFKLLYFSSISISDLIELPLDAYNPVTNEFSWKGTKNGIGVTLTITDKKILDLLSLHLKVNEPKKFLFENVKGKPLSIKSEEAMFECFCQLAEIENEEKWQWQTLIYTRNKNNLKKTA